MSPFDSCFGNQMFLSLNEHHRKLVFYQTIKQNDLECFHCPRVVQIKMENVLYSCKKLFLKQIFWPCETHKIGLGTRKSSSWPIILCKLWNWVAWIGVAECWFPTSRPWIWHCTTVNFLKIAMEYQNLCANLQGIRFRYPWHVLFYHSNYSESCNEIQALNKGNWDKLTGHSVRAKLLCCYLCTKPIIIILYNWITERQQFQHCKVFHFGLTIAGRNLSDH